MTSGAAAMRPLGEKMVLNEPYLVKTHLFGQHNLVHNLPQSLVFGLGRRRARHLHLIEHSEFPWTIPPKPRPRIPLVHSRHSSPASLAAF